MKIALLTDGLFPYVVGGIQKHALYLAKHLARSGVFVDLYFAVPSETVVSADNNLFSVAEEKFIRLIRINRPSGYPFPGHYIRESFEISSAIWSMLKEDTTVDFIFAQGFAGWYTLNQKKLVRNLPPIGVHFHGLEMWQKPATFKERLNQWMFRPFVKKNIKKADVFLSYGERINKIVPLHIPSVATSSNAVSKEWIFDAKKENLSGIRRFLFVGRYERRKGIEELHDILAELDEAYDFTIDIIGPVPEHFRSGSSKVKYWGLLKSEEQIRSIMQKMEILVCPSYSEGMPTVILEAMASGLAILASDVGAVAEMVSDKNGWLIAPGDRRALKNAMIAAITEPGSELELRQLESIDRVRQDYLWETVANRTIEQIENILR